ncbi:MAG: glycosyltransferase [ANME-2 cluster archaeon]|nr:MAG: glycosyltransferase [ANME-2 cluster archaeon]
MKLSIIIPSYREEENLKKLLPYMRSEIEEEDEIIVVESCHEKYEFSDVLQEKIITSEKKCRAYQMNKGAREAKGDLFYFVHADTMPPKGFREDISHAIEQGYTYGCYPFRFDSKKWYLKVNAFATKYNFLYSRGGDQSLFITKEFFTKLNGFDEYYVIMEEYDLIRRAQKIAPIHIMKHKRILVSARKYNENPYWKVNWANLVAVRMFKKGKSPDTIKKRYACLLKQKINRY